MYVIVKHWASNASVSDDYDDEGGSEFAGPESDGPKKRSKTGKCCPLI